MSNGKSEGAATYCNDKVINTATLDKKTFIEPKLEFIEPKLTVHGDVTKITQQGFFGVFTP